MFTGYDTGCFKFLYAKLISRNRTSKNASGGGVGGGGGGGGGGFGGLTSRAIIM